eukprot:TRINITY_DN2347_c0_g1_i1.p1 TRINITY_DN2347_c0_g1~~TRINITY_DN2347_c0_g1_i1.p1  ORF type:complete len:528 (+),score=205.14 TRINITY_DN2347_c0_g1_i1:46-1584(+)
MIAHNDYYGGDDRYFGIGESEEEAELVEQDLIDNEVRRHYEEVDEDDFIGDEDSDDDVEVTIVPKVQKVVSSKIKKNDEEEDIFLKDMDSLELTLKQYTESMDVAKNQLKPILNEMKENNLDHTQGYSLLETKYNLMLNYCMNLTYFAYLKSKQVRIKDHPVVSQLVELKVMLERLKPLEDKVQHQFKTGTTSVTANLDQLISDDEENEEDDDDMSEEEEEDSVYQNPGIQPVYLDSEDEEENKPDKRFESEFMRDLYAETTDAPAVQSGQAGLTEHQKKLLAVEKEREEYEERTMTRLQVTKKDRKRLAELNQIGNITELEEFDRFDEGMHIAERFSKQINNEDSSANLLGGLDQRFTNQTKKHIGGDDDFSSTYKKRVRKVADLDKIDLNDDYFDTNENYESEQEIDEDYYMNEAEKKRINQEEFQRRQSDFKVQKTEGKNRLATYEMDKNRGINRYRKKEGSSRVRNRRKAEKAKLKSSFMRQGERETKFRYSGEKKIDPSIVRSKSLK